MKILIRNISHEFGQTRVLNNLTLVVEEGEIVVVLGPSGCGKTTLLRLVGGLDIPSSGSIRTRHVGPPSGGQSIAYVFQEPTLLPWRTVAGNVALPLEHTNVSSADRHRLVAEALARVKLAEFANSYPKSLSGGMRQRASIARALVVKPAALLMDEPLASLDEQTRELLLDDLIRLWGERPYTCLYVTHSPAEAVRIGHRVVVLSSRPGTIREIVSIDVPIDKRSDSHPMIVMKRNRIWDLIRNA